MNKDGITVAKYGGDDAYSWAIFVNGKPVVTGLTRREIPYHRSIIEQIARERAMSTT